MNCEVPRCTRPGYRRGDPDYISHTIFCDYHWNETWSNPSLRLEINTAFAIQALRTRIDRIRAGEPND